MSRPRRGLTTAARHGADRPLRAVLANGTAVVLCPCEHLSQSYAAAFFGVGSRHEQLAENGLTHILEHMLFRGTASYRDATALNLAAEEIGGFLEGATYRDHVYFATGSHPSSLTDAIDILGEVVGSPRYQGVEIERSILREELLETVDREGRMIDLDNIAHRAVFGSHGLGLPIEGTLQNLEASTVAHMERHRETYLVGNNAVVSVAGPFEPDRVMRQVERAFGGLGSGAAPMTEAPPEAKGEPLLRYVRDSSSQVEIRITFRAMPVNDSGYPALVLLGRVLGDGLASRMNAELVDRQGLAYSLHAGLTRYSDCGLFEFDVTVAPDRAAEAVRAILGFAKQSSTFRFTADEIDRVLRRYRFSTEFRRDSAADLAIWHGCAALFGIEAHIDGLGRRMSACSPADIRKAAKAVFRRESLVLTAAGELARGEWSRVRKAVDTWRP